jgi:tetratricopeptide (TPR) repeat protein
MVIHRDPATAASHYARARAAGVDLSAWAFNKAYVLDGPLGHFDEAIAALGDAELKDPLAPTLKWILIEMQLAAGRTAQALETAERLHQCQPRVPGSMAYEAYAFLAAGDLARTEQSLLELKAATSDDFWHVALIKFDICAATGKREDAQRLLDDLMSKIDAGVLVSPFIIAVGYAALGDSGQAVEWWKRAVEQHHPHWAQMTTRFRCHPVIGKDPRFLALLRRMGLESDAQEKGAVQ